MKNENTAKFLSGFAAIVGRPNVGKSTLMNAMVGEKVAIVSNRPQTTRNRIMGVTTDKGWQIVFLDTPGLHKPRTRLGEYMVKSVQDAMDGIDVLLVLVDANEIGPQDRAIVEEMSARKVKKILVLNKTDIVEEARLMAAIQSFAEAGYDAIVPISARTGKGMDGLITVTLLVEDNHITCIETTQEGESQSVGGYEAIRDGVYANMIDAAQGSDIDAVSGATITTAGIRQAVEAALAQARA